jgi:hypothetical protein
LSISYQVLKFTVCLTVEIVAFECIYLFIIVVLECR